MHPSLRSGLILLLLIPSLMTLPACAKRTRVVKKETKTETNQAEIDRQRELEAERQRKEAEQRRFRAAKTQFIGEDIYFKKGSYRLQPKARTVLYRKADFLRKYPQVSVIIEGHTDDRPLSGSRYASNWELSSARAISVVRYLMQEGISPEHLVAAGFGEFQPIDPGESDEALARNRRIELKLTER